MNWNQLTEIPAAAWGLAVCFIALAYTFIGYPILVTFLARIARRKTEGVTSEEAPPTAIVLAVFNEQERILARIENLLDTDYPTDKLSIIIVSDGSTDETVKRIEALNDVRVRVVPRAERSGKPACLNVGIAEATSDVIVFADARQRFERATIPNLVRHFANPQVGAVSGALMIDPSASAVGGGVDAYWKLEKHIRSCEARWDSCIGCTGAVYAIRRELYEETPADTLVEDVVIPMRIATKGKRVMYDYEARAFDPQQLEPEREVVRKERTLAGNYQMLFRYFGWLFPWRNRLWWQLISHKYLRLAAPFFMMGQLVANAVLLHIPAFLWLFGAQCAFYALAFVGRLAPKAKSRLLSIPSGFVFLNLMSLRGLVYYLSKPKGAGWKTAAKPEG